MKTLARLGALGVCVVSFLIVIETGVQARPAVELGKAYRAFESGNFEQARLLAAKILPKSLRNPDYRLYVLAQSAYFLGDFEEALTNFKVLAGMSHSRLANRARWRSADALWQLRRRKLAAEAYEKLVRQSVPDGDAGVARFRLAKAAESKSGALAILKYKEFLRRNPAHRLSKAADDRLVALGDGGLAALSHVERIARGRDLIAAKKWERALIELSQLDLLGMDEPTRLEHEFTLSMSLFKRRRHYEKAGRSFLSIYPRMGDRAAESLFHGARALSRADFDSEAIENYQKLVREFPESKWAAEAQFLSGWLEFNRGRYNKALPYLRVMLKRYPQSRFSREVPWYQGFSYYLLGEYGKSIDYFAKVALQGGKEIGGKGRYWQARAREKLGQEASARPIYEKLVSDYPFSWYALLSLAHLESQGVTVGVFGNTGPLPASQVPALAQVLSPALQRDEVVQKADELIGAGLLVEAGAELFRGERAFLRRHKREKGRALAVLLDTYQRAENYNRPWMLAVVHGGRRALNAEPMGPAKIWWQHAYPLAYEEFVEKYRKLSNFPDYYLYTIMRKESGFRPHTHSYADAQGLLQMIPPTTERVVKHLGITYTEDLLFDPEKNIEVGAWYIGRLFKKFHKQIPVGAGSYNSGPRAMSRWLKKYGDRPLDEFVELLSYRQTRKYMKRTTETYARYKYLYQHEIYRQPLALDSEFIVNDVDY